MSARHLLVLHPDPLVHRKVRSAFKGSPVRVHSARTFEDVDGLLHNGLDILLASTSIPDGNGYEAGRLLKDRFPAALVVFIASAFEVYDPEKAAESGGDAVLRMPMTSGDVRAKIESLIGPLEQSTSSESEAVESWQQSPPTPEEQLARFLPRSGEEDPLKAWVEHEEPVDPAVQEAILRAMPRVLEGAIRTALQSSPAFRQMVAEAVREAVDAEKSAQALKDEP
jgi:DNA-binding NarL/FixJ family response regulator